MSKHFIKKPKKFEEENKIMQTPIQFSETGLKVRRQKKSATQKISSQHRVQKGSYTGNMFQ
jgi:hypothetical protein